MMATIMSNIGLPERMPSLNQHLNYIDDVSFDDASPESERMRKVSKSETIHSGHFMVSEIDDAEAAEADAQVTHESDIEQPDPLQEEEPQEFALDETSQATTQLYSYGPTSSQTVKIDASLSKLFKCMSLAYCGKLTSPKWKTFKGLKLKLKDKIRLNNIIWRAWHIQYIMCKKPPVCQFSSLVDYDSHNKPEAVVLEGKYWKRKHTTVSAEYQKWRLYHKQKSSQRSYRNSLDNHWLHSSSSMSGYGNMDDDFVMDFNDTSLFNSLIAPNMMIDFPNPREITRSGFGADFIQPGLTQLQPSFDDYMDLDFLLSPKNISILPTLPEETAVESSTETTKSQAVIQNVGPTPNQGYFSQLSSNTTSSSIQQSVTASIATSVPVMGQNTFSLTLAQPAAQTASLKLNAGSASNVNGVSQQRFIDNSAVASEPLSAICTLKPENEVQTQVEVPLVSQQCSKPSSELQYASFKSDLTAGVGDTQGMKIEFGAPVQQAGADEFVIPKLPAKQRVRSRSVSSQTKQLQRQAMEQQHQQSLPQQQSPQHARTSLEVPVTKATVALVERSNSLPVYTQRKTTLGPMVNAQLMQRQQQQLHTSSGSPQDLGLSLSLNSLTYASLGPNESIASDIMRKQTLSSETSPGGDSNSLIVQLLSTVSSAAKLPRGGSSSTASGNIGPLDGRGRSTSTPSNTASTHVRKKSSNHSSFNRKVVQSAGTSRSRDIERSPEVYASPLNKQTSPTLSPPPFSNSQLSPVSRDSRSTTPVLLSPLALSPTHQSKAIKSKSDREKQQYREHRRVCHINAEQKRRCNIKNGFDTLRTILPSLNQNSSTKISKAAMLQKAAEHIRSLKADRSHQQDEYNMLKEQIESLNTTISIFQSQLPATGAPFSCQRTSQIKEKFDSYVEERVEENWKFWIFSIIMKPLLESYNNTVTTTSIDDMYQSVMRWLDQNCSLMTLRPNAIGALRYLSTSTNVLTNPASLPQEAIQAATRKERKA